MRRLALINQKGGVGKTTTAVNLGACLAEMGRRVVLVDLDPQANLTLHLGLRLESGTPTSYRVLLGECTIADALRPTAVAGLSFVPTDIDLSGAELELASAFGRETLLRDAVEAWCATDPGGAPADYLLLDCPPSLGLLSINGLAAAAEVLLPVQTEFFALQGLTKLMETVELVQRRLNPGLVIGGIVPCLYDSRLRLAREVLAELRNYFPGQVLRQTIGTNVKLAEAPSFGQTILEYAPDSAGARDYRALAREIVAQEAPAEHAEAEADVEAAPAEDGDLSAVDVERPAPTEARGGDAPGTASPGAEATGDVLRPAPPRRDTTAASGEPEAGTTGTSESPAPAVPPSLG